MTSTLIIPEETGLHRREGEEFKMQAYLNSLDMRDNYPILDCAGAVQAVVGMAR